MKNWSFLFFPVLVLFCLRQNLENGLVPHNLFSQDAADALGSGDSSGFL